ncbi:MAG: hypothetical protein IPM56_05070 [Ignavibacteriales bacterium]|nr:MAG: hypothetical protein IPM56_05070 [Ignavibacteriales bacterium]
MITAGVLFISFLLFAGNISGQTKTNLESLYVLLDSASTHIAVELKENKDSVSISLTFGYGYEVLKNYFRSSLNSKINKLKFVLQEESSLLNVTLDEAKVEYTETFKDGFFGSFYTERVFTINGSYFLKSDQNLSDRFNFTASDTIPTSELQSAENFSYPFTTAERPSEPFFSSLFEPVVAVGATALAVILFFTIRSK